MEPGISSTWKMLHTITTYGVAIPSFITAFAIFASFELVAIKQGRRGFIATVKSLPWSDPTFSGAALGMMLFILGGFGGLVNASYSMDTVVHNTIWIVGHFHVTVGGPVALTFLGAAYWMIPRLTGSRAMEAGARALSNPPVVLRHVDHVALHALRRFTRRAAPHGGRRLLWCGDGQCVATVHAARCRRRVLPLHEHLDVRRGRARHAAVQNVKTESMDTTFATAAEPASVTPKPLQRLYRWGALAFVLAVLAYAGPLGELLRHPSYLAPGMRTW